MHLWCSGYARRNGVQYLFLINNGSPTAITPDYHIQLDAYAGPLDLLLYLVKRHEIDLHDIPIAELTEQYMRHLSLLKQVDIHLAGEFLVMASTLLEIKSQMILPRPEASDGEVGQGEISPLDPRYELVQQLLEYKRFKDAAVALEHRFDDWRKRFAARPAGVVESTDQASEHADDESIASQLEIDLEDVNILDLCEAFSRILDSVGGTPAEHEVTYDDTPISLHAEDIVDRLSRDGDHGRMTLQQIFVGRTTRALLIGLFLATLELVRQKKIRITQDRLAGEIALELIPDDQQAREAALVADPVDESRWIDPTTGEVDYAWPDPAARESSQRRAQRRSARLVKIRAGKGAADGEEQDDAFKGIDEALLDDATHLDGDA